MSGPLQSHIIRLSLKKQKVAFTIARTDNVFRTRKLKPVYSRLLHPMNVNLKESQMKLKTSEFCFNFHRKFLDLSQILKEHFELS